MKQYFIKGFVIAGIALVTVPAFAQQDKAKDKADKERQTIVIIAPVMLMKRPLLKSTVTRC